MMHRGEIPPCDVAIFADTQEEPGSVMRHLEWLIREVAPSFRIEVRTAGKIGDDLVSGRGPRAAEGGIRNRRFASIPAFTKGEGDEKEGLTRRQCTAEYKLDVIERFIRREVLHLAPRQRMPRDTTVVQVIGLSADEPKRILNTRARFADRSNWQPEFPLWDRFMSRPDCVIWLQRYGVPHRVPRSACVICPYRTNDEWADLKAHDWDGWLRAVEVDRALRAPGTLANAQMNRPMFLHRSCVPLDEVEITQPEPRGHQLSLGMNQDCVGLCGL
jgi:hypothetical protein